MAVAVASSSIPKKCKYCASSCVRKRYNSEGVQIKCSGKVCEDHDIRTRCCFPGCNNYGPLLKLHHSKKYYRESKYARATLCSVHVSRGYTDETAMIMTGKDNDIELFNPLTEWFYFTRVSVKFKPLHNHVRTWSGFGHYILNVPKLYRKQINMWKVIDIDIFPDEYEYKEFWDDGDDRDFWIVLNTDLYESIKEGLLDVKDDSPLISRHSEHDSFDMYRHGFYRGISEMNDTTKNRDNVWSLTKNGYYMIVQDHA